ncbi:ADP-ribosyltransferase domain-containing protein [Providencia alcalifaciens]|uniref:NAD(+)--protein-arginine ADP-ribosyltransferase n=1 Tax=Providencia alcalifaciens 205/92 TaxID=1256988 RepID=A0AAV3M1A9_9GAMM|nr:ADP-ribosyltransferase domain-containing protein [Providencia alcalifaciens]EUD09533.1 NAD:arginine ADP-ribosyltransferase domain protein [Providencia alcalifaciens 205/92]MTC17119.1 hypothetical protein [Providencia alcalifaciens]MTC26285.1 hypothetical protein [Providencia alcalifaciens]MTC64350.1 hypothetical protein [Providencia alcalifaciens]WGZ53901.1 ADP-ribosyltransferase domain-containing protein [Providencia alcalifaciens]
MSTINTNTQSTQYIQTLSKQALKEKKQTLSDQLKVINNTIESHRKQFCDQQEKIEHIQERVFPKLMKISDQYGSDSMIRIKNKQIREQPSNSFLKKLFFGNRYKSELKIAAEIAESKKSHITASEFSNYLDQKISKYETENNELTQTICSAKKSLPSIKKELTQINAQLEKIQLQEAKTEKITEEKNDFALIYQSNAGCKAINAQARNVSGPSIHSARLDGKKIIREYERVHGSDIFTKGNKHYIFKLKYYAEKLNSLVETATQNWYTPTMTTEKTYRGQGMTIQGLQTLIQHFNADKNHDHKTVYQVGQFFSTSSRYEIAERFAKPRDNEVKVIFTVMGNSGSEIDVSDGLRFNDNEREKLYSPLANFTVTNLTRSSAQNNDYTYHITLEEVPLQKGAKLLPY